MKKIIAMLLALMMVFALVSCGNTASTSAASTEEAAPAASEAAESAAPAESAAASTEEAAPAAATQLDVFNLGVANNTSFTQAFDISGAYAGQGAGYGLGQHVYDTLFYLDRDGNYGTRTLADWSWDDACTTLTMTLKDNIYFSNGDQLLMDDVLFSLKEMQNSGMRSGYYTPYLVDSAVISEDGLTMSISTEQPYAAYQIGLDYFILDKDYVDSMGGCEAIDWYDPAQVVGSGPYTCTAFVSGASATFELRDDYWDAAESTFPYKVLNVTNYTDATTMCMDFESGVLDAVIDLAITDYDRLAADAENSNLKTFLINSNVCVTLALDSNNCEMLKDAKVREAICSIVNPTEVAAAVGASYATPATSIFGVNELGYVDTSYTYDPDYAAQCMAESSYPNGGELKLACIGTEPYTTIAEVLQAELAPLGITITIDAMEIMSFINGGNDPDFTDLQLYTMQGGTPSGEPSLHLDNWYSDSTSPVMAHDYCDEFIDAGNYALDTEARIEAYQSLQEAIAEHFDAIGLYEMCYGCAYNSDVWSSFYVSGTTNVYLFDNIPA